MLNKCDFILFSQKYMVHAWNKIFILGLFVSYYFVTL